MYTIVVEPTQPSCKCLAFMCQCSYIHRIIYSGFSHVELLVEFNRRSSSSAIWLPRLSLPSTLPASSCHKWIFLAELYLNLLFRLSKSWINALGCLPCDGRVLRFFVYVQCWFRNQCSFCVERFPFHVYLVSFGQATKQLSKTKTFFPPHGRNSYHDYCVTLYVACVTHAHCNCFQSQVFL